MMRNGIVCQRPPLVPLTAEIASSSLPTPVAYDACPGGPGNHYHGLGYMAKHVWPTPTANDAHNLHAPPSQWERNSDALNVAAKRSTNTPPGVGNGHLNPTWVEWLMGFPLGWTDCEDSETP